MKKLLLSTAVLGLATLAVAPKSVSAGEARKTQKTDVGVSFKSAQNHPDEALPFNLTLVTTPTMLNFNNDGQGFDLPKPGVAATLAANDRDLIRYIVVNDDRAEADMSKWTLTGQMSQFKDSKGVAAGSLVAELMLDEAGLSEWKAGAYNGATLDYDYDLSATGLANATVTPLDTDSMVKSKSVQNVSKTGKEFVFPADSSTSVPVLEKAADGKDSKHSGVPGEQKGGQGYALKLENPRLKVKSGASEGNYTSTVTWVLTYDDPAIP